MVAVKQANNDELRPVEGLAILAGNDDVFLRTLELGAAPAASSSPRTWSAPQMREMWDAAQEGDLERAREIDAEPAAALRGAGRDHQPDPGQGGAGRCSA